MISVRQALDTDAGPVCGILQNAAEWLIATGQPLWRLDELEKEQIAVDVQRGLYCLAEYDGEPAGVMRFQLEDPDFWPDVAEGTSAFVHRLAVQRRFAGMGVSTALLDFAVRQAHKLGRSYLRLDCESARLKLRAVYERYGFRHHSDRTVGPYHVARYEFEVSEIKVVSELNNEVWE